jgi:hypothetical protein
LDAMPVPTTVEPAAKVFPADYHDRVIHVIQ